jgi:hypothetical protein
VPGNCSGWKVGEAKNRRLKLLGEQPTCIFCGEAPSTEEDHYPPRSIFPEKQWPVGFSFGACERCNKGSRNYDLTVAVLSRFCLVRNPSDAELAQVGGYIKRFSDLYPDSAAQLFGVEPYTRESVSAALGVSPILDASDAEYQAVEIPAIVHEAMRAFMAKLSKALHFTHTRRSVPTTAGMRGHWFSNADSVRGQGALIPPDVERMLGFAGPIERSKRDLRGYFDYRYAVAPDGAIGAYLCAFGTAFLFMSIVTLDATVIEGIIARVEALPGKAAPGQFWMPLAWPPPNAQLLPGDGRT